MVLICPYCGNTNPDYALVCGRCGKQLVPSPQQSNPVTAPYPQQYTPNQLQPNSGEEVALYFIQIAGAGRYFDPVSVLLTDRRVLSSKSQLLKNVAIRSAGQAAGGIIGRMIAEYIIRRRNINKVREVLSTIPPNEIIKELRVPIQLAPQLEKPREIPYEKIKKVTIRPTKSRKNSATTGTVVNFMGSRSIELSIGIPLVDPQHAANMIYNTPLRDRVEIRGAP
ncbi:zinc ribbon domain-containing protein [Stygiolobus caldivivus]|uniref:Zinc-ribbon domain-containing protein n=1 Tax=Stygiolobus caldivivus TaxID=2824673 RepID=A0A8D5U6D3_9CREN|nr:zinc ribbon domain-containing protein [Stygiolobus caldivivus]BCU69666.1 hypothetical protein KN1_09630 [Stygiolobus caldivivus]